MDALFNFDLLTLLPEWMVKFYSVRGEVFSSHGDEDLDGFDDDTTDPSMCVFPDNLFHDLDEDYF
jgi:hypothetical protein